MLSKETEPYFGADNPFRSWWEREDEAWRAERVRRWPTVSRSVRDNVRSPASKMKAFQAYYVDGTASPDVKGYMGRSLRIGMIPWRTVDECRQAMETYIGKQERQLRTLAQPVLYGGLAQVEGLPVERHDDEGIARLLVAAEAIFPAAFTAADAECRDDRDPAYFQERGKGSAAKPYPFMRNYQNQAAGFLARKVRDEGSRILINPSERVIDYYLSCVRYVEEQDQGFAPEGDAFFTRSLDALLTELLFFDELNPGIDADNAVTRYARAFNERLAQADVPAVIQAAMEQLRNAPPELVPHVAQTPDPFGHLRFFAGTRTQYEVRGSPDAETWVEAIARFGGKAQRDRVMRLMGEPGRPADESGLGARDKAVYQAIAAIPTPRRVRSSGPKAVFFEWCDWHYDHDSVSPLVKALQGAGIELAFIRSLVIDEDGDDAFIEVLPDDHRGIPGSDDPLFEPFLKLIDG